jgi:hypothetical protein
MSMTDTLAYQIGAVFFLAVLFMAGTLTRGLFPTSIFKNVKLTTFTVAALLVGFVAYRGLPDISHVLDFTPRGTTQAPAQASASSGVATKQSSAPRPVTKIREVQTMQGTPALHAASQPQRTSKAVVDPPLPIVSQPQSAPSSPPSSVGEGSASAESWRATPAQESGNRVKLAIKSVGHFLHIGHEKYRPPPSVPQPVATQ